MQIIKVRAFSTRNTVGCEKAPIEILDSLSEMVSERGKVVDKRLFNLEEIHVDNSNVKESNELIYKNGKKILEVQDKSLFVGGDHSVSYGLVRAFKDVFENPFLIVFDAHVDCMDLWKEVREPDHEEWLAAVVKQGFPSENIIVVGVRNIHPQEKKFLQENNIKYLAMSQLEDKGEICDMIMERARQADAFYISIDVDVVDPAYAPGTGYLEPGGLTSRELLYFLQRLTLLKNFRGADIVEVNPDKDPAGITVKLGAKILAELI